MSSQIIDIKIIIKKYTSLNGLENVQLYCCKVVYAKDICNMLYLLHVTNCVVYGGLRKIIYIVIVGMSPHSFFRVHGA